MADTPNNTPNTTPPSPHPLTQRNQIRFDAPASAFAKAFSSEETQRLLAFHPGSHYAAEAEVRTSAPYGDKFVVVARYTLVARGARRAALHAAFAVSFAPALSRVLQPMIARGVEGGIRASFATLRRLLAERHPVSDLPDTPLPPAVEGAPSAAAAAAAPGAAAAAAAEAAAAAAEAAPFPAGLADFIAFQRLVGRLLRLSDPAAAAKALAALLTLALAGALGGAARDRKSNV